MTPINGINKGLEHLLLGRDFDRVDQLVKKNAEASVKACEEIHKSNGYIPKAIKTIEIIPIFKTPNDKENKRTIVEPVHGTKPTAKAKGIML